MSHTVMSHTVLEQPDIRHSNTPKSAAFSPSHEYAHMLFEGADMVSSFWQPLLKSVGRWQLEVSGLGMKHGQAALKLSHELARAFSPSDVYAAHVRYWEAVSSQVNQSQQRIAAATVRAAEAPLTAGVVPLVAGLRGHDIIKLPDDDAASVTAVRKVA